MIKLTDLLKEGATLNLVDPNTNKNIKTFKYSGPNRDADAAVEKLNAKLTSSQKQKGLSWKISTYESVNEAKDYEVYHKSYTEAIQTAKEYALKKGYLVDEDDSFTKIGMGPKRPSEGKTNRFSVELTKGGKPTKKQLHIQVYGMKNGYELNCYIN